MVRFLRLSAPAGAILGLVVAGCETSTLRDGVQALQFADIPVPAEMQLQDENHASDSLEIGDYRYANFVYAGSMPIGTVSSYLLERMPQHAWTLVEQTGTANGVLTLRFQRGRYWADCQLSRASSRTRMEIAVRTRIAEK
jgi:hypothetical protein